MEKRYIIQLVTGNYIVTNQKIMLTSIAPKVQTVIGDYYFSDKTFYENQEINVLTSWVVAVLSHVE